MAGRAKILQSTADPEGTHPCVPKGMAGGCVQKCYGLKPGEGYKALAREEGADFDQCVLAATAVRSPSICLLKSNQVKLNQTIKLFKNKNKTIGASAYSGPGGGLQFGRLPTCFEGVVCF
jgi:hypothetical protein